MFRLDDFIIRYSTVYIVYILGNQSTIHHLTDSIKKAHIYVMRDYLDQYG